MLEREHEMIGSFSDELERCAKLFADADEPSGSAMAREARESRESYLEWLSGAVDAIGEEFRERTLQSVNDAPRPAWIALNRLYAHLQAAVEETCVHMLVQRHAGRREAADQAWRDSYAYMLHATEIVESFASRNWALELASPEVSGDVRAPAIARAADGALARDRERAKELAEIASETVSALSQFADPELEAIPKIVLDFTRARVEGTQSQSRHSPRPIEAMLADYAYPTSGGA